jgi:two-component system cell cycle sensor histidine kinase/response regulator CckA
MNGFAGEVGAPLQLLLFLVAGGFGAGLFVHLVSARDPERRVDHLLLAATCLLACAYLAIEACALHATDLALMAGFCKAQQALSSLFMIVYPAFVYRSTGVGGSRVCWAFAAAGATFFALALQSRAGLRLSLIDGVEPLVLPWGETIWDPRGPLAATLGLFMGAWGLVSIHGIWCALRSRAVPGTIGWRGLAVTNAVFLIAVVHDTLQDLGYVHDIRIAGLFLPVLAGSVWWRLSLESRRRIDAYRELFRHTGIALFIHEAGSGELVDANDHACALIGRRRPELIGRAIGPVLAAATGPDPVDLEAMAAWARAHGEKSVETVITRPDGTRFPAELTVRPIRLEDRERMVVSLSDLTERRRAHDELIANEQRLRTVIERSPIPIAVADLDGRVHAFNPRFTEAYGYTADEAATVDGWARLARRDAAGTGPGTPAWRTAIDAAAAHGGVIPPMRLAFLDKAGHPHHAELCGVVVGSRVFLFFMELTEILSARDELARHEAFLGAVIDSATDGVCVYSFLLGSRPAIVLWNPRMAEITGTTRDQALSGGWSPGAGPGDPRRARERVDLITSGLPLSDEEWELARPDGSLRVCAVSTSLLPSPEDERRILVNVRDLTEVRRAEEERRGLDAKLEHAQKLESLGVLAGGIAHDFNNILVSILGRTDLIRVQLADSHQAQAHLLEVKQASRRAADLCQQMLAYAGRGRVEVGPVDLGRLVDDMGRMLEVAISKRVTMVSEYAPDVPTIVADASQLQQVVMNLITNASDACGGEAGTITRRIGRLTFAAAQPSGLGHDLPPGDYVFLEIADTGCGMDAYTRSRMFDPFFTTKFTGRGLGMAAVLGIVRTHRGGIEVASESGRGTTVRVLFPAGPAPVSPAMPGSAQALLPPRAGAVLVVDDEASVRSLAADMLSYLGHRVLLASSGAEAIAIFRDAHAGIGTIILDLTMPDLGGEETLAQLRRIVPGIRVILASGYSRHEVARLLENVGPVSFLQKPFDVTGLAGALAPPAEPLAPPA